VLREGRRFTLREGRLKLPRHFSLRVSESVGFVFTKREIATPHFVRFASPRLSRALMALGAVDPPNHLWMISRMTQPVGLISDGIVLSVGFFETISGCCATPQKGTAGTPDNRDWMSLSFGVSPFFARAEHFWHPS
jgi:hypothetical protein